MENIVNLEQLDYRDRLIKNYIDEHTSAESSYEHLIITTAIKRVRENDEDIQHAYVGVPEGTSMEGLSLKFFRHSTVKIRNKSRKVSINWDHEKYGGYHEIWAVPTKNKVPLINIEFKDSTSVDFTKGGFDFYEITGRIDNTTYDRLDLFANSDAATGYVDNGGANITYGKLLTQKNGGVCVVKNEKKISNVSRITTVWSEDFGTYRLSV